MTPLDTTTPDHFSSWDLIPRTTMIAAEPSTYEFSSGLLEKIKHTVDANLKDSFLSQQFLLLKNDQEESFRIAIPVFHAADLAHFFPSFGNYSLEKVIKDLNRRTFQIGDEKLIAAKLQKEFDDAQQHIDDNRTVSWTKETTVKAPAAFTSSDNLFSQENHVLIKNAYVSSTQGKRRSMQDTHLAGALKVTINGENLSFPIFDVFDGHYTDKCAKYLAENLKVYLQEIMSETFDDKDISDLELFNILKKTFVELGEGFIQSNDGYYEGGSTACIALIIKDHIWVANVGDSRAILSTPEQAIALSEDASLDLEKYTKGVNKRGQFVEYDDHDILRVRNLNMARAVGHFEEDSGVNPRAKIIKYPLEDISEEDYLVIACDGLWNVASSNQVSQTIQEEAETTPSSKEISSLLAKKAYNSGSQDNISVMVIKFKSNKEQMQLNFAEDHLIAY